MIRSNRLIDHITGIKYYLLSTYIDYPFRHSEKTFYVEEIVDLEALGFTEEKTDYTVFLMTKRNIETIKAIEIIARVLGIPSSNIYYLGLKDKHATSKQYIFIKTAILRRKPPESLYDDMIRLQHIGFVRRKPSRKFLLGNKFKIIIENKDIVKDLESIMKEITSHGLPNYYGYQRFGARRPNSHILGKFLLLNRYDLFTGELLNTIYSYEYEEEIVARCAKRFSGKRFIYEELFSSVYKLFKTSTSRKRILILLLEAYLSYLFNALLNKTIEDYGCSALNRVYPVASCRDSQKYYGEILVSENISYDLLKGIPCWFRTGILIPKNVSVYRFDDRTFLEFELGVGEYASVVLREIFKNKYMLY